MKTRDSLWRRALATVAISSLIVSIGSQHRATGTETGVEAPIHIFAFDDDTIPYKDNLKLTLVSPQKYAGNPVLLPGPAGSVDAVRAQFYGSVIRVGQKFRMWYSAISDTTVVGTVSRSARIAYAESGDGIRWVKPDLGLTEFQGNKRNNLVGMPASLDFSRIEPLACFVLHEPEEQDSSRRYKMAVYGRYYLSDEAKKRTPGDNVPSSIYPFFSEDGLNWRLTVPQPKGKWFDETEVPFRVKNNFEIGGLFKFDGLYYVAGQELSPDITMPDGTPVRRTMVTHWSGDFVHWSQDRSFSFQRYGYRSPRQSLQEAHEPAGIWNRRNVLLGLYGLWHGASVNSERRMDLGLLISNDGIHFREPIPDYAFIPAGADGTWDQRGLIHGQGYEQIGDQTHIYYGAWDPSSGGVAKGAVGLATMRRDGFGYLSTREKGDGQFTTRPLTNLRSASLSINVEGVSQEAVLRIELIDKTGNAIEGYSGRDAAVVADSGLSVKVSWSGRTKIEVSNAAIRLRVSLTGPQAHQVKFYAAYLE
jgi:hypothetical protein